MDLHDTPDALERSQIIAPGSYHAPPTFDPRLKGERISNHHDSASGWRQEPAPEALRSARLDQRFPDVSLLQRASLPWVPAASLTPGTMLGQMMELRPSRAPLATQEELYATLHHFSKRGGALPRDRFFYGQAGVIELISLAVEKRLLDSSQAGSLFVGVQHLSRAASQFPRYRALAHHAREVCLYGLNDLRRAPERCGFSHPRLVVLELDRTRRTDLEWFRFIVIDTPEFSTALVAQQLEGDCLSADVPQGRTYRGFWTFDSAKVCQIAGILGLGARNLLE